MNASDAQEAHKRVQAMVAEHAEHVTVELGVVHEPKRRRTGELGAVIGLDPETGEARRAPRLEIVADENGEAIRHPLHQIHLRAGRVTCTIDLHEQHEDHVSPEEYRPRTHDEVLNLARKQLGNLLIETTRKPRSIDEIAAETAEIARRAAEDAARRRAEITEAHLASMAPHEGARHRYMMEHGEFPPEPLDRRALETAVQLGALSRSDADREIEMHEAWNKRHAERAERAERAEHIGESP